MSLDIFEIIKGRRSIRGYLPTAVPEDSLLRIFEAARWAPSAHNVQPWRFIVIVRADLKQRLAKAMTDEWLKDLIRDGVSVETQEGLVRRSIEQFTGAPVLILACISMKDMDKYPDEKRQRSEHIMATQSLTAAIQNMLLTVHSQGLGACWFCAPLFCQDVVRGLLEIPNDIEPQALITLGYPSEEPEPPPKKPLKEIVFRDRWGEML